jgi:hypothetical protein
MAILKLTIRLPTMQHKKHDGKLLLLLFKDGKGIEHNDVMSLSDVPEIGDKLFLDANNNWHFLKHDTYVAASMPAGCTFVGVVFDVQGNTAKICHKTSSSQKWADVFNGRLQAGCWIPPTMRAL